KLLELLVVIVCVEHVHLEPAREGESARVRDFVAQRSVAVGKQRSRGLFLRRRRVGAVGGIRDEKRQSEPSEAMHARYDTRSTSDPCAGAACGPSLPLGTWRVINDPGRGQYLDGRK